MLGITHIVDMIKDCLLHLLCPLPSPLNLKPLELKYHILMFITCLYTYSIYSETAMLFKISVYHSNRSASRPFQYSQKKTS
jgi:hypothetical protein